MNIMTNINITPIIETVIGLIITIVSVIVIPKFKVWISNNLSEKQINIAKIVIHHVFKPQNRYMLILKKQAVVRRNMLWNMQRTNLLKLV